MGRQEHGRRARSNRGRDEAHGAARAAGQAGAEMSVHHARASSHHETTKTRKHENSTSFSYKTCFVVSWFRGFVASTRTTQRTQRVLIFSFVSFVSFVSSPPQAGAQMTGSPT